MSKNIDDLEHIEREQYLNHPHLSHLFTSLLSEIIPGLVRLSAHADGTEQCLAVSPATSTLSTSPTLSTAPVASHVLTLVNQCQHPSASEANPSLDLTVHVEQCSAACLQFNAEEFMAFAQNTVAAGLDIEVFYLDVIPQTVRLLHDLWARDEITFLDVTRATWVVKRFVLLGGSEFVHPDVLTLAPAVHRFQAMVCMASGSQHTLGALLVSQYLQRKGWNVIPGFDRSEQETLQRVSTQWVDLFCVSASTSSDLPGLKSLIKRVKSMSKNKNIQCLLGGPVLAWEPELQNQMGVHGLCHNVRQAHTLGLNLVQVHRKARKLNALTATELGQTQTQALREAFIDPLAKPKRGAIQSRKSPNLPKSNEINGVERESLQPMRLLQRVG